MALPTILNIIMTHTTHPNLCSSDVTYLTVCVNAFTHLHCIVLSGQCTCSVLEDRVMIVLDESSSEVHHDHDAEKTGSISCHIQLIF